MSNSFIIKLALLASALVLLLVACERAISPENPNLVPNTTLANIPVENDTLFALVTLHWDGEDNDGYIAGYEYRYITSHLVRGDSVVQPWQETKETSLTIAFESSDAFNYQKFQVRAVDNDGDVDPTPAEKHFYTKQTILPKTEILFPSNNQIFFAIDHTTDWWPGIKLMFTARDDDGEVVEYAWAVDQNDWHWMNDTIVYITPDNFLPLEGKHKIRVASRDNTNLVDPIGDSVIVELIKPSFNKRILVIDETVESKFPLGVVANDDSVDKFYQELFQPDDQWDYTKKGMPDKRTLGQYQLLIWHADNAFTSDRDPHKLPEHIEDVMDYLNVGGDFIMSGWRILKSFAPRESFPKTFQPGSFIYDYLHIIMADETPLVPSDFTGAISFSGFSPIRVDSFKLAEAFPYVGKLSQINIIPARGGFTSNIYIYDNAADGLTAPRGMACGLRYYGTSFDAVVFGFPIYFIRKSDAKTLAQEILRSLGY